MYATHENIIPTYVRIYASGDAQAAYIRILIIWVAQLAVQHVNDEYEKVRAMCMWSLADFLAVLDYSGLILTEQQAEHAWRSGRMHLTAYMELCHSASIVGRALHVEGEAKMAFP